MTALVVWLCPVCFSATEANRDAFLGTTILLSLLPLAFIAAVLLVLRDRAQELSHGEEDADA